MGVTLPFLMGNEEQKGMTKNSLGHNRNKREEPLRTHQQIGGKGDDEYMRRGKKSLCRVEEGRVKSLKEKTAGRNRYAGKTLTND